MGRRFRAALLVLLVLQLTSIAVQASTWDRIASYLRLLQRAGVKALVAPDCPLGLLGAFHEGKQALLMCGNNLPCLLYTSPSPRDRTRSRMPSSA